MFNISRFGEKKTDDDKSSILDEIKRKAREKQQLLKRNQESVAQPVPVPETIDQNEEDNSDSGIDTKKPKLTYPTEEHDAVTETDEVETVKQSQEIDPTKFTILGSNHVAERHAVSRTLPDWIQNPFVIPDEVTKKIEKDVRNNLVNVVKENLKNMGIKRLFPVQTSVVPALIRDTACGLEKVCFPPCDICVSSPTGSGKTLAFAIPIVNSLINCSKSQIRAIAVLPTKELAAQVYKVFCSLASNTDIRVVFIGAGRSFENERQEIFSVTFGGVVRPADIIVSTPGKLVDHLQCDNQLNLSFLRFLIIDEADRMLDDIKQSWLSVVEKCVYSPSSGRTFHGYHTLNTIGKAIIPLQKLLFSATLSADPEKLEKLGLFQPRLFTAFAGKTKNELIGKSENKSDKISHSVKANAADESQDSVVGKFVTPSTLTEFMVDCKPNNKPLLLIHIMSKKRLKKVLCFTRSVETSHRLYHVLEAYNQLLNKENDLYKFSCAEFSSHLSVSDRKNVLAKFKTGKINILICSDSMARGIDVKNVEQVVNYEVPKFMQNYVHRVGRTARAGKTGEAFTFLTTSEMFHFKKMISTAGKKPLKKFRYNEKQLNRYNDKYDVALEKASNIVER